MGIMLGGELGTMDNLSREFSKQIQTVDGLVSAVDAQVNNVQWTGKVADDFRATGMTHLLAVSGANVGKNSLFRTSTLASRGELGFEFIRLPFSGRRFGDDHVVG